jgi:hypothetical protein
LVEPHGKGEEKPAHGRRVHHAGSIAQNASPSEVGRSMGHYGRRKTRKLLPASLAERTSPPADKQGACDESDRDG